MAIAYQSIATTNFANSTDLVISKPTGLAVDDYMVAFVTYNSGTISHPSGWTQLFDNIVGSRCAAAYKKADSSDVAASNFTWTTGGASNKKAGSIMRFSGVGAVSSGSVDTELSSTATPTFTTGITPTSANSYLIFCYAAPYTQTASAYAITTDNPTWTEVLDINTTGDDRMMALAYASRPETTATGNFTLTISTAHDAHIGCLLQLNERIDVSVTGSTGSIVLNGNAGTVAGSAPVTGSTGVLTLNGNAGTFSSPAPDWVNTDKNSSTWTNLDKS